MTKFDEKIEKAVKSKKKILKKDYNIKPQPTEKNKKEQLQEVTKYPVTEMKEFDIKEEKRKIIKPLLKEVEKVNIIERCKILGWKPKYKSSGEMQPPNQKELKVALIDYFLEYIGNKGYKITKDEDGSIYIYNGAYWIPLNIEDTIALLKAFSIKVGIPPIQAKEEEFKNKLYKQFYSEVESISIRRKNLINLLNGTFDIETMTLRDFDYRDFLTYQLPFAYEPKSINELWLNFLDEVLPDKETQRTFQEAIGSIFVKNIKIEKAIFLYGSGHNGKSVAIDVIKGVLGKVNVCHYSLSELMEEHYRADLKDKLVNLSFENTMKNIDSNKFKTLASGEPIGARQKYGKQFIMENYARLMFAVNELKLSELEATEGFFRRFLIIPFKVRIPEEKKDPELSKKILQNPSGVLNWIIEGARRVLMQRKIIPSSECNEELSKFRTDNDSVALFIDENNYKKADYFKIHLKTLYNLYSEWCMENGFKRVTNKEMKKRLISLGYKADKDKKGVFFYMVKKD